jgi:hypothetical protein
MTRGDLSVGMRIRYTHGDSESVDGTVTGVDAVNARIRWDNGREFNYNDTDTVYWSRFTLVDSQVAASVPAVSRDFPPQCPRCGAAAYIGFRTVEHEHGGGCR